VPVDLFLLLSTLGLGLRHGVDWDHIAAITDITGAEVDRRRSAWLAVLYALGHGAAVLALGSIAIVLGDRLPNWIDPVMERVVGVTLVGLAVVLLVSLRRGRRASRGLLLFRGLQRVRSRVRRSQRVEIEHSHPEPHAPGTVTTTHVHAVDVTRFTVGGAVAVGLLHGIGAETGTQALVLVSASRVTSPLVGVAMLSAFVAGIVVTTAAIALGTAYGWKVLSRDGSALRVVTIVTALVSGAIGLSYLTR
jgi:high-affinity nickel-transport protein